MATPPDLDPTDFDQALTAVKAATAYDDADGSLSRRLVQTAVLVAGVEYWRPLHAACRWLRANPRWIEKLSGSEGIEYRPLEDILADLLDEQRGEDARLGLVLPDYLAAEMAADSVTARTWPYSGAVATRVVF